MKKLFTIKNLCIAACAFMVLAANIVPANAQKASDPQHKVKLDFNRWHDYDELKADLMKLEKAYPKFLKYSSIGKSFEGRDMMLVTMNNPDTGKDTEKPAMYIEANVHGNEIQGGEVVLYTIWYLMENYGRIEAVTELVNERSFYFLPVVNPDGRQYFMAGTGSGARTGHYPVDNDGDGLLEEDGPNDLNGNGVIEQIRKYVPGEGTHMVDPDDNRIMIQVRPGEKGDYVMLGSEGLDDDGDGFVNEDPVGGYDPNRNWGGGWQPNYIQRGSLDYPFQLPASRAVNDFLRSHPNIAGAQSFHNSGGMILRPPGSEGLGPLPRADVEAYDKLGLAGERMLPYYDYIVTWVDLYTAHGGFFDWTNSGLGIMSFSNELWNGGQYYNSPKLQKQRADQNSPISGQKGNYYFDDKLEMGDQYIEWAEFDHPIHGKVEMGGWKKFRGRVPPRFMLEELAHRNMAFTLFQAQELPQMKIGKTKVEKVSNGVFKVWIDIVNDKITPTITVVGSNNNVVRPDIITFDGRSEVISASWVNNKYMPGATQIIDQNDLKRIQVGGGHPGQTTRTIQYLVRGSGSFEITYDSQKGGKATKKVDLR